MIEWLANPLRDPELEASDDDAPLRFHRALTGYAPSALIDAPELAAEWGVGQVRLKFERERFGLPSSAPPGPLGDCSANRRTTRSSN